VDLEGANILQAEPVRRAAKEAAELGNGGLENMTPYQCASGRAAF